VVEQLQQLAAKLAIAGPVQLSQIAVAADQSCRAAEFTELELMVLSSRGSSITTSSMARAGSWSSRQLAAARRAWRQI
jgi:hypothetical protein